ncbi:type II toxin-antitoxin system HicA family toxin [Stenotrophomonas maltophilia]|uniref:type II toxin-antitoxin system HicA family toxin n=1 Tax=Stenotrophomonas maltophilia TaxID=40324 RepID=UPI001E305347
MKSRGLIRDLEAAGWTCRRIRGSHHVFVHPRSGFTSSPRLTPKRIWARGWCRHCGSSQG